MLHEGVSPSNVLKFQKTDLRNYSTELATGSRNTMRGRAVSSGEDFTGYHERRRVGPEVLEEICKAEEDNKAFLGLWCYREPVIAEA